MAIQRSIDINRSVADDGVVSCDLLPSCGVAGRRTAAFRRPPAVRGSFNYPLISVAERK